MESVMVNQTSPKAFGPPEKKKKKQREIPGGGKKKRSRNCQRKQLESVKGNQNLGTKRPGCPVPLGDLESDSEKIRLKISPIPRHPIILSDDDWGVQSPPHHSI